MQRRGGCGCWCASRWATPRWRGQDQRRLEAARSPPVAPSPSRFFTSSAGHWDRMRGDMFGDRFHLAALAAFADADAVVGDLGCGTGRECGTALFVARVIGVDSSAAIMLQAARRQQGHRNVELRRGDIEALPIDDGVLDAATVMLVLHHVPEPGRALADVARALKPGGRLVLVDMLRTTAGELPAADGTRLAWLLRGPRGSPADGNQD